LALVLLLPLVRVAEAGGRLLFLPGFYDSFGHALTGEPWFSEGWWLYTCTCTGWCASRLLVLWLAAVPVVLLLPMVLWRKTLCVGGACLCLAVLEVSTSRLEMVLGARTETQWVWCLRSHDPEVRRGAANMLAHDIFKFGLPPATASILRGALRDDEVVEVRRLAVAVFARHLCDEAVPELTSALEDSDAEVRKGAAAALSELGARAVTALSALNLLLRDGDVGVRVSAAEAYLRAGGDRAPGLGTV
jgi:hypothetical protein